MSGSAEDFLDELSIDITRSPLPLGGLCPEFVLRQEHISLQLLERGLLPTVDAVNAHLRRIFIDKMTQLAAQSWLDLANGSSGR